MPPESCKMLRRIQYTTVYGRKLVMLLSPTHVLINIRAREIRGAFITYSRNNKLMCDVEGFVLW
jgi:hypothetical protein